MNCRGLKHPADHRLPRSGSGGWLTFLPIAICAASLLWGAAPHLGPLPAPQKRPALSEKEKKVRVAILHQVATHTTWPGALLNKPDEPITIGILGKNVFGKHLTRLQTKKVRGRPIRVRHFRTAAAARKTHILVITFESKSAIKKALQDLAQVPVVTIGEGREFVDLGGIVGIVTNKKTIIGINLKAAKSKRLKLHASLVKLARWLKK